MSFFAHRNLLSQLRPQILHMAALIRSCWGPMQRWLRTCTMAPTPSAVAPRWPRHPASPALRQHHTVPLRRVCVSSLRQHSPVSTHKTSRRCPARLLPVTHIPALTRVCRQHPLLHRRQNRMPSATPTTPPSTAHTRL